MATKLEWWETRICKRCKRGWTAWTKEDSELPGFEDCPHCEQFRRNRRKEKK